MVSSILPLKIEDAVVRKSGHVLLDGVSTSFDAAGTTIVLGPNGCGKTTLLRLIHGLERLRSGTLSYQIEASEARQRQSFVFQHPTLLRRTVLENIAYPLLLEGGSIEDARQWAERVGLSGKLDMMANRLSGGERQKLAFARAMVTNPQVLLLDEPTTNLDGQSTKEIEELLKNARKDGTKIIMATHDLGQAKRLADNVKFLHRGKILEDCSAASFFTAPSNDKAHAFLAGDILV